MKPTLTLTAPFLDVTAGLLVRIAKRGRSSRVKARPPWRKE
jgi:hypothetical protein